MKRHFAAIAAAISLSVPTAAPANAETHYISRDYRGSICVQASVQNRGNLNIRWGSWYADVDIRQAQASARGASPSMGAGMPGTPGMLLLYVNSSYKAYQLLVDSTQPAYIQFEARGNNVEAIDINGAPHRIWTGQCGINGVSVNSIIRL
jgi:hypothetical protein